jgi:Zn-dependent protease with chaperone function
MALPEGVLHPKEQSLKPIVFAICGLVWLIVVCTLVGLCYGLLLLPFVLMSHAYFLGYIRGNALRVSESQLPELHRRVVAASQKLNLPYVPEVYVLESGGVLNAFATKLFSRKYVILYSELLDKCNDDAEIDFVVAHELGHHAAGHLQWMLFTAPVRIVPLLGPAYSRACEYTCDRAGLHAVGHLEHSQRALTVLSAGSKASAQVNLQSFAAQQASAGEFWPAVAEIGSTHPFLPKRAAALAAWKASPDVQAALSPPSRPFFSYILAIFMSSQGMTLVVVIYVLAILAAIAIPNFKKFQERARGQDAATQPVVPQDDLMGNDDAFVPDDAESDSEAEPGSEQAPDEGR